VATPGAGIRAEAPIIRIASLAKIAQGAWMAAARGMKAGMAFVGRKIGWILGLGALGMSCTAPQPAPNIADPDPQVKIAGIRQAVAQGDRTSLPGLVQQLDSDDAAVRFYAQQALERLAGERFGYEYYLDEDERKPSLARWQDWLKKQTIAPTTQGAK